MNKRPAKSTAAVQMHSTKGQRDTMTPREFVDRDRDAMDEYYDLCEKYTGRNKKTIKSKLTKLIEKDPDFLDSYLLLFNILKEEANMKEAEKVLDKAYKRAIALITDENGNWPAVLEWGWLENRHIIRTILNKALFLWTQKSNEDALTLLRALLKAAPRDSIGARHYILGIRMGLTFQQFENRFKRGGFYHMDLFDWFDENFHTFPDEFDWWEKAVEEYE